MPKNTTILALAGALTALAAAITEDYGGECTSSGTATGEAAAPPAEAPKKRGRPPATEPTPPPEGFKTYDELKEIIKPLVEAKRAQEVRAILKHLGVDTTMKDLPNEKQAEFLKDVEALLNDSV